MSRKSIRFSYILIGLLILSVANLTQFFPHSSSNSIDKVDEKNSDLKPSDLVYDPFIVGVSADPTTIDPVDAYSTGDYWVIDQVCEGLFKYNISDPDNPRINWLAESYWWEDKTTLRIKLREGILFHDGFSFNSTAVQWNLDRVNYLTNATGMLIPPTEPSIVGEIWKFPNGTGIMTQIDTVGEYNITIHLQAPYGPFLDLLCHSSAYMISPISHSPTDYIVLNTDDLIGTGPFEYDVYNMTSEEIEFHAFDNYWQGVANITKMEFSILTDPTTRNNAMFGGTIDFLCGPSPLYYSSLIADPDITFSEAPTPGFVYRYIGMNNEYISRTWRKAISYAVNYTYIIKEILSDGGTRAYSPISTGFGDGYYNCSDIAPYYNLTLARQTLIDAGITSLAVDDDAGWAAADLITIDYTYYVGSTPGALLYLFLTNELDKIGVTISEDVHGTFFSFLIRLSVSTNANLFWVGWGADYLDPFNMFSPMFYDTSPYNNAFVNSSWINSKLDEALDTLDDNSRDTIYHDIQINVSSYLYPHIFVSNDRIFFAHNVNLTHFPYNGLHRLDFYSCEWIPTYTYVQEPPPIYGAIFVDDSDPNFNWSKTALENDWCSGSGTWDDPYVIENITVDGENTATCIQIANSDVFFRIRNCTLINGAPYGIYIQNSNNSFIYNNSVYDVMGMGVLLEYSDNHTIYENKFWNMMMGFGIYIMYSNQCEVINNTINDSWGGIGTALNYDTLIIDNAMYNNTIGIGVGMAYNVTVERNDVIESIQAGIWLSDANETIVKDNLVTDCLNYGITVGGSAIVSPGSHNNTLKYNRIYNSMYIGLYCNKTASHNEIFLNEFIGNSVNAIDNGTSNMWDNGVIGNSWDDYAGFDTDDNGIGDTAHPIGGTAGSVDNFPIYDDGPETAPTIIINSPIDNQGFSFIAPTFSLTIIAPEYDTIWYTLDGGVNNYTCSVSDQVDPTLWAGLGDIPYTLRFYANRSNGLIGTAAVSIYKDTIDPVVTINEPDSGDEYTTTIPIYDITVTDLHLATYWYTLEGGTPIPISTDSGSIDETAWNALPNGQVNITFYAIDYAGNIGFSYVLVNKNAPTPAPEIPGPSTFLILMILFAGIISLTWVQKRKLK